MGSLKEKDQVVTIDPNEIKTRDYLLLDLINGVTKSGVHIDRKKEANRNACRKKINHNED
jgi:hypothetical protein